MEEDTGRGGIEMRHTFSPDVLELNPGLQDVIAGKPKAANKYHNIPTEVDGHTFDSKKEAKDYVYYKLLQDAGQIRNLTLQPRFMLQDAYMDVDGKKHRAIEYVADFMWQDVRTDKWHVKDTKSKGTRTTVFAIKEKMFRLKYPMYVYEVG
jgi:hypothetical protein